jgi:indolepyruvate ferredoxin oxidoreductase beta subunit
VVISLEKLEALRFAHFINPDSGTILANDFEIVPASVANSESVYPHQVFDYLKGKGIRLITLPATQIARDLGDGRMANVVLLGVLSTLLPIPLETWEKTLHMRIPKRYLDGNLEAFAKGREAVADEISI